MEPEIWSIDYQGLLAKHDIVYQTPTYLGFEGLPLGDGVMGAMQWHDGRALLFALNRVDAWDRRDGGSGESGLTALRSCGRLMVEEAYPAWDWTHLQDYEARLDLYAARTCTVGRTAFGRIQCEAMAPSGGRAVLVHYRREAQSATPLRIRLERWGSRVGPYWYGGLEPAPDFVLDGTASGAADGAIWIRQDWPDRTVAAACLISSNDAAATVENPHAAAWLIEGAALDLQIAVGTACRTHDEADAEAVVAEAIAAARAALSDPAGTIRRHRNDWAEYWQRGFVTLPNDYLENLYYFNLYQMRCASLGRFPQLFCGGVWTWNHDVRNWQNPHHWNQQMLTWPLFTANRLELAQSYVQTYAALLPAAQAYAAELGCPEGVQLTEMHTFFGDMLGKDSHGFKLNYSPAAQIGLMLWWAYVYSGDRSLLRDAAYPWLKGALHFYRHLVQWDEARQCYTWFPATPYESGTGIDYRDTITDNAMIRWLCRVVPKAAEILEVDPELEQDCRELAKRLPNYPTMLLDDGTTAFAIGYDEHGTPLREEDMFGRFYAPVYPSGDIGLADRGSERFDLALASVRSHRIEGPCIGPKIAALARLGQGEEAWTNLLTSVRRLQHFPQGFFYNLDHWNIYSPRFQGDFTGYPAYLQATGDEDLDLHRDYLRDRRAHYKIRRGQEVVKTPTRPFAQAGLESMGLFCTGLHEMLLQSHEEAIRLFPAVPDDWEGGFKLRAQGGFVIAAYRHADGRCPGAIIESGLGGVCRVQSPWPPYAARVWDLRSGDSVMVGLDSDILAFATEPGGRYLLSDAESIDQVGFPAVSGRRNASPKRFFEAELGKPCDFPRVLPS